MMRTSSGKCSLCAMQPSLMDNNKMGGIWGEHNNQTAAVETAVLGSCTTRLLPGGAEGRSMMAWAWERGGVEGETSRRITPQQMGRRADTDR